MPNKTNVQKAMPAASATTTLRAGKPVPVAGSTGSKKAFQITVTKSGTNGNGNGNTKYQFTSYNVQYTVLTDNGSIFTVTNHQTKKTDTHTRDELTRRGANFRAFLGAIEAA
jgi:hypothetical protein